MHSSSHHSTNTGNAYSGAAGHGMVAPPLAEAEARPSHHAAGAVVVNESCHSYDNSAHYNNALPGGNYIGNLFMMTAEAAKAMQLAEDEKSWKTMDSVHSRASTIQSSSQQNSSSNIGLNGGTGGGGMLDNGHASFDFNDSMASFASFGGGGGGHSSNSDFDTSDMDLTPAQRASFTSLDDDGPMTMRHNKYGKAASMRTPSAKTSLMGGPPLGLIEERDQDL